MVFKFFFLAAFVQSQATTTIYRYHSSSTPEYVELCPCPANVGGTNLIAGSSGAGASAPGAVTVAIAGQVGINNAGASTGNSGTGLVAGGSAPGAVAAAAANIPVVVVKVAVSTTVFTTTYTVTPSQMTDVNGNVVGAVGPTVVTNVITSTVTNSVTSTTTPTSVPDLVSFEILPQTGTTIFGKPQTLFVVTDSRGRLSDNSFHPEQIGQYTLTGGLLLENSTAFFSTTPGIYETQVTPTNANVGPLFQKGFGRPVVFGLDNSNNLVASDVDGPLLFCLSQLVTNDYCGPPGLGQACDTSSLATSCQVGLTCAITPGSPAGTSTMGTCRDLCLAQPCPAGTTCTNSAEARNNQNILFSNTLVCIPDTAGSSAAASSSLLPVVPVPSVSLPSISVPSVSLPGLIVPSISVPILSVPSLSVSLTLPVTLPTGLLSSPIPTSSIAFGSGGNAAGSVPPPPVDPLPAGGPVTAPGTDGFHIRIYRSAAELANVGIACDPVDLHAL